MALQLGGTSTVWSWTAVKLALLVTAGPIEKNRRTGKVLLVAWVLTEPDRARQQGCLVLWIVLESLTTLPAPSVFYLSLSFQTPGVCSPPGFSWREQTLDWRGETQGGEESVLDCLCVLKNSFPSISQTPSGCGTSRLVSRVPWSLLTSLPPNIESWKICVGQTQGCSLPFIVFVSGIFRWSLTAFMSAWVYFRLS
jgi:hypothetical protein